ncbi:MAG: BamA/TamA family outer membrane protein [Candidatus Margulisbacteria bacterium]|nr:BamA/TamA family outer membrane protein [Candidatus Margulisiibacteriota bacterium]
MGLLIVIALPAVAFKVGQTGTVNAVPYVIYNSTYGLYYGVIGKAKNIIGQEESMTLSAFLIANGGNGANFVLSLPDDNYRHGKKYNLAFDLLGNLGYTISERFYGLGSETPGSNYTTLNNNHSKYILQFSRSRKDRLILEGDLFFAGNQFSNIVQGVNPITPQIEANCRNYVGGSLKLTLDGRDQSLDPHAGFLMINEIDFGLKTADYIKGSVDLRGYSTPFRPDQILASRLMLTQSGGPVIPIYEYAFLGGRDTMRGYTMNRWRDRSAALVNLEYRFPLIWQWFQAVVFYEVGKVGDRLVALGGDSWASDYGFGLHLNLGGNVVVRGDFGRGTEGANAYFFYNQAF